jgi:CRP-like cAMP-binding protein
MIGLEFLKGVDIFKGLNENQLVPIQAGCREKKYESGNRLFAEGDAADQLWIVIEGQVDLDLK